jgi:alkanesulfonate monooxygenase SsuD/methylene tetrahydromethanopterin reductase-like flavin-dependent oxidoreductase (luciferase family)
MARVSFGWRIPAFPVDASDAPAFRKQISSAMEIVQDTFNSAWISDHPLPWASWQSPHTPNLEGWTALTYYSALYNKLIFGHVVLCNSYRNPALLAKMTATLSFLTGGRFVLGIGAGWKEEEYRAYGYEYPKPSIRIAQLEEGVQIIKRMWREDRVTFHGKYFHVEDVSCDPKPDPVPPIMIGGGGEKLTMKVAARYADWWNCPNLTVDQYRHKLEVLRGHCNAVGRSYEAIRKVWLGAIAIAKTEREARKIASGNPFVTKEPRFDAYGPTIIGTPAKVVESLERFKAIGVDCFIFRFLDFPRITGTKLFSDHVIAALK